MFRGLTYELSVHDKINEPSILLRYGYQWLDIYIYIEKILALMKVTCTCFRRFANNIRKRVEQEKRHRAVFYDRVVLSRAAPGVHLNERHFTHERKSQTSFVMREARLRHTRDEWTLVTRSSHEITPRNNRRVFFLLSAPPPPPQRDLDLPLGDRERTAINHAPFDP